MITDVQERAVRKHVEWCKQMIAENNDSIAWFSQPGRRLQSRVNDGPFVDVTQDHIAKLTRSNNEMQAIVDAYAERGFQTQVGEMRPR